MGRAYDLKKQFPSIAPFSSLLPMFAKKHPLRKIDAKTPFEAWITPPDDIFREESEFEFKIGPKSRFEVAWRIQTDLNCLLSKELEIHQITFDAHALCIIFYSCFFIEERFTSID